jgi:energy-converting hydrogenase Eha subunit F
MTPRHLSIIDLANSVPGAVGIMKRNNKEEVDALLHSLGFCVKMGYTFEECYHRPFTSKTKEPIYGMRIVGFERRDPEWVNSEHCSWENKIEEIDEYLKDDLEAMSKQSNFTADILKHIENNKE